MIQDDVGSHGGEDFIVPGLLLSFVACANLKVVGFYALTAGSVSRDEAPGRVRRRMPEPIPVMVLGRLAVDLGWQRRGIGPWEKRGRSCFIDLAKQ
jgi:hypothetical protein